MRMPMCSVQDRQINQDLIMEQEKYLLCQDIQQFRSIGNLRDELQAKPPNWTKEIDYLY